MKKLLIFGLLMLFVVGISYAAPRQYSSSHVFSKGCDSTSLKSATTDSLTGGTTGFPYFYTNIVSTGDPLPTRLDGIVSAYISTLDTGDASTDYPDTSKDTLIMALYTAWHNPVSASATGDRVGEKLLYTCSLVTPGVGVAKIQNKVFKVPADSALGSVLYWRATKKIQDSDYSCARVAAKIHYTTFVTMYAR